MTPTATPPDSRPAIRFAATLFAAALAGGCGKPPQPVADDGGGPVVKGDPWKAAAARLRKDTDFVATKSALSNLSTEVGSQGGEKLPALSGEAINQIAAVVPLAPEDREEINGSAFSAHDPAYLSDCFYLRDAARSLSLDGLAPEKQAELAFEWVCRQVYLQPWLLPRGGGNYEPTALPPTAVLRRGFGSGLERMYVFLSLLQQLGIDACLVGAPDSGGVQSRQGPAISYPNLPQVKVPRGPFWAVGVRAGNDARLFDPWRGQSFPATLNQLKANPEAHKAWFEDKANISGVTTDDAKKATAFLAVPVNALSARMGEFESHLKDELGVKVAYDLKALQAKQASFGEPKPAYWNPVADPFAYGRVSRAFLPLDLGGEDRGEPGARLYDLYVIGQIPASAFRPPKGLEETPAADRIRGAAGGRLHSSFIDPPNPRERIQRGQFQSAAQDLVAKQEAYAQGLERLRTQDTAQQAKQIEKWGDAVKELYQEVGRARLNGDKTAEATALESLEVMWRDPAAVMLVDRGSAEVGRAEASYLLALCKHEQAARLQAKLERAAPAGTEKLKPEVRDSWKTALGAWRTYEQLAAAHAGFPGRAEHAKQLSDRAERFAEAK